MARFCVAVIVFSLLVFSTVAESAEPERKLEVVCPGKNTQSDVKCQDNHGIVVDNAEYGKKQNIFCPPPKRTANNSRTCNVMKDVTGIIRALCDGKERCDSLIVNTANLGEVKKCENLKKYLLVYYKCVKIKEHHNDQEERPNVVEPPKKNIHVIQYEEEKTSTGIMFDAQHNSSTSVKTVELYVLLLVLGIFCSFSS